MIQETGAIVLKQVKYGETSLIVTLYTAVFGLQHYLVQGVRSTKSTSLKANLFRPGNIIQAVVYHQPNKNLQRIKEASILYLDQSTSNHIVKNGMILYLVELIQKSIVDAEPNPEIYEWIVDCIRNIDTYSIGAIANYPIVYTLQWCTLCGIGISFENSLAQQFFDLQRSEFVESSAIHHAHYLHADEIKILQQLQHATVDNAYLVKTNGQQRHLILTQLIQFIRFHISDMPAIHSVDILHTLMQS